MLMYMINKLKRIQNATGGYIFERYGTIHDVIILHWLLKKEHTIQFDKTRRRSLYSKLWSKYLPVELPDRKKNCVHWNKLKIKYGEKNTFQH